MISSSPRPGAAKGMSLLGDQTRTGPQPVLHHIGPQTAGR